jgi:hypothetical protein
MAVRVVFDLFGKMLLRVDDAVNSSVLKLFLI